jgi:protein gp37
MNRTKIEWTDFTWNPVVGCDHGCWYCYADKITKRFPKRFPNGFRPTFHPERLQEPWEYQKPSKIFACSVSDLFAPWTLPEWRFAVLRSINECPVPHTFQLLTKNPERIWDTCYHVHPVNSKVWIGTTVTNEHDDWRNIEAIKRINTDVLFASFEPLLGPLPAGVSLHALDWIIIGKLTGSRKVKLDIHWVWDILARAEQLDIPVFVKNNLLKEFPLLSKTQEFPS